MRVGIGLPNTTPGTDGALLVEWARRAESGRFSSVAVLDRLVYESLEPFVSLAAAAAVTERVRLATMVAIGPLRNTAMLAKQTASLDVISNRRFVLGLAVGGRHDDYDAAGVEHKGRGKRLSEQLAHLRSCDAVREDLELLVGGASGEAFQRMARYADGYAHGGGPPRAFAGAAAQARAAWSELGRPGEPVLWGQGYFSLADTEKGSAYLRDYYAFTGPFAEKIAAGNLVSARAVKDFVRGYEEAGCDELILLPTVADIDEVERLAEALA